MVLGKVKAHRNMSTQKAGDTVVVCSRQPLKSYAHALHVGNLSNYYFFF
jgi:hypothetical protein